MKKKNLLVCLAVMIILPSLSLFSACGKANVEEHKHSLVYTQGSPATCTEGGTIGYWHCSGCDKYFSDSQAADEIDKEDIKIPPKGHSYSSDWSYDENNHWHAATCGHSEEVSGLAEHTFDNNLKCTVCGYAEVYTQGLEYALINDGKEYEVTGIGTAEGAIVVPRSYEGKPVTKIADYAFMSEGSVTEVVIPNSVVEIGSYAFFACTALKDLTLPASVELIGEQAFANLPYLTNVTFEGGAGYVGASAFNGCINIQRVNITDIAGWCGTDFADDLSNPLAYSQELYSNDELISDLVIPDGVERISSRAFFGCSSLVSVSIPASVTEIGAAAFGGIDGLTISCEIDSPADNWDEQWNIDGMPVIWDSGNNKIADDGYLYADCNGLRYRIGGGSATLYKQRRSLSGEITVPAEISVEESTYPVEEISPYAFAYCENISAISTASGINKIGECAFSHCFKLESVRIGDSVTDIGAGAFESCTALKKIVLPQSLGAISDKMFSGCWTLTDITIPDSVTEIGEGAFEDCNGLTDITIPGSVEQIGDGAFSNCTDLLTVVFKDGVKVIGNNMFYACFYLQTVIIPDSVETIGKNAFIACNRLTAAYYEGSEEEWNKIEAGNTELSPNVVYFYSLEQPSAEGNYWHYVDSVPVIW